MPERITARLQVRGVTYNPFMASISMYSTIQPTCKLGANRSRCGSRVRNRPCVRSFGIRDRLQAGHLAEPTWSDRERFSPRSERCTRLVKVVACALLQVVVAAMAAAQINDEINAGLQFNFSPPGARSLAMGSAFSGLADDATAAYSNPAGLLWLSRPEVSVEGRSRSFITVYPDIGSASGTPRGVGIDARDDLVLAELESNTEGFSFLSFVHVPGKRWRVALYRHEFANFESKITSQGPFIRSTLASGETPQPTGRGLGQSGPRNPKSRRLRGLRGERERLWLGLGLSFYDFRYDAVHPPVRDHRGSQSG